MGRRATPKGNPPARLVGLHDQVTSPTLATSHSLPREMRSIVPEASSSRRSATDTADSDFTPPQAA